MKRLLILLFICLFMLAGCASSFEGDYEVVTDHNDTGGSAEQDNTVRQIGSFAELTNALKSFINSATEYGVIKAVDYSGSLEDDFSRASRDVTRDYPMGVYAVDYISYKISPILTYYEIEVYITYKLTKEEISRVIDVESTYDFYNDIDAALENYESSLTVQLANLSVSADSIKNYIKQYYKSNPDLVMQQPSVSVVFYPSPPEDYVEKIINVQFVFENTAEQLKNRKTAVQQKADLLFSVIGKPSNDAEAALLCIRTLCNSVNFSRSGNTAYDAISGGAANSEGYAMAYKLLCKHFGVDCDVVEGKKNGEAYYWNIVGINGDYYHVDPVSCDKSGLETGFLKKDSDMLSTYWWDIEQYKKCNGDLTYEQVVVMTSIGENLGINDGQSAGDKTGQ